MADGDDVWSDVLYRCTFAGLPIDVLSTRDSFRRSLVAHEYPNRDGAIVHDMGAVARGCDCRVIFYDPRTPDPADPPETATQSHVERAAAFVRAAQAGEAREFVHPIFGTFPALAESLDVSASGEERDQIVVSVRFIEQGLDPAPLQSQIARQIEGGAASVAVEAELATQAAATALPARDAATVAAVTGDATAEVDAWADPDIDARAITIGLQRTSTKIEEAIRDLDLASDPKRYPLYRALARLHYQIRRAATRARRDAPALIRITTASAAPLRVILGDVYGARDADRHMAEAIRLNTITDPALVAAGTDLTVPTPSPVGAQGTRRQGPAYGR